MITLFFQLSLWLHQLSHLHLTGVVLDALVVSMIMIQCLVVLRLTHLIQLRLSPQLSTIHSLKVGRKVNTFITGNICLMFFWLTHTV